MQLPLIQNTPRGNNRAYYVSLGDSISIDAYAGGPGRGGASLLFQNRAEDFPEWAERDLVSRLPGARMIPLAQDGATSATVRYAQIPRLREMKIRPAVVTVTFGGNDLMQTFGDESLAPLAHRAVWDNGHALLAALRRDVLPDAPIIVGTIYDPSDGTGEAERLGIGEWPDALDWIARFNETLRALADEHGAIVADMHARFQGHGLTVGAPSQPDPRPADRNLWYCGVIEPNAWGAGNGVRAAFWDALDGSGFFDAPSTGEATNA